MWVRLFVFASSSVLALVGFAVALAWLRGVL